MEKFLFKKIEMWIILILFLSGILFTVMFGWALRYHITAGGGSRLGALGAVIESIAAFPSTMGDVLTGKGTGADLLAPEQRFKGLAGFRFEYEAGTRPDLGYVLVNRYDGELRYSVADLWDLNKQEHVHRWHFGGVDALWEQSTLETVHRNVAVDRAAIRFRNGASLLDEHGNVFTHAVNSSPLIKADICSNLTLFQDDAAYHHSLERDHEGNFWVPKYIEPKTVEIPIETFRDDGIAKISPEGELLFEKSVMWILEENGLAHLIYGRGHPYKDPIHLNDIQPALIDGAFWKQGDLFVSLRHQSMVFLYRPSTNEVLWYQLGPWLHQHDVDILNDHEISVFNNNAYAVKDHYGVVRGVNNALVYDFETDKVRSPWQVGFEALELRTRTEGLADVVGDEVFVEETKFGRLVQFLPDGTLSWQFVNRDADGQVYQVSWSRLIPRDLGDKVRVAVSQRRCS